MSYVVNGATTTDTSGTSHTVNVGVNDAAAGDYEFAVLFAEAAMGAITAPLDYAVVWNSSYTIDTTHTVYVAVYDRTSAGETGNLTFGTANSLNVVLMHVALTGNSGQSRAGPSATSETVALNGNPFNASKSPAFPNGVSLALSIAAYDTIVISGFGYAQATGPADTSSQSIISNTRGSYVVGVSLLPLGDDPFEVGYAEVI